MSCSEKANILIHVFLGGEKHDEHVDCDGEGVHTALSCVKMAPRGAQRINRAGQAQALCTICGALPLKLLAGDLSEAAKQCAAVGVGACSRIAGCSHGVKILGHLGCRRYHNQQGHVSNGIHNEFSGGAIYESGPRAFLIVEHSAFLGCSSASGGAIYARNGAAMSIEASVFARNFAVESRNARGSGSGGAIDIEGIAENKNSQAAATASLRIINSRFVANGLALIPGFDNPIVTGGHAVRLLMVRGGWSIRGTSITPFDNYDSVFTSSSGFLSCDTSPCEPGEGCTLYQQSIWCSPCPAGQISSDGVTCHECTPGKQRVADNNTACEVCPIGRIRATEHGGQTCSACEVGTTPNIERTHCEFRACPRNQFWNPLSGQCTCASGFYNTTSYGHVCCMAGGSSGKDMDDDSLCNDSGDDEEDMTRALELDVCLPCPTCTDCTIQIEDATLASSGPQLMVRHGFNLAKYSEIPSIAPGRQRRVNVFQCPLDDMDATGCQYSVNQVRHRVDLSKVHVSHYQHINVPANWLHSNEKACAFQCCHYQAFECHGFDINKIPVKDEKDIYNCTLLSAEALVSAPGSTTSLAAGKSSVNPKIFHNLNYSRHPWQPPAPTESSEACR
eukprot:COSAG05_NODE_1500_length_4702_cov_7.352813_1_plen_618_part_00